MTKIILYPNFAGVDIKQEDDLDEVVKNISLLDILPNEKHKDDDYFSSVEMKQYLDKMTKDIDKLDPIILIKNPLEPGKYNVLDGHHRFQLFKKLNKKTIPAMVVDEKIVFLAKDEYGTKNNKAVRMDKADLKQMDLKNYFNTTAPQDLDEKWSEKYKKSIDCNNPKGFSQKAHCQGKNKKMETKEMTGADSAGAFAPAFGTVIKKKNITKIHNMTESEQEIDEVTDASSSGSYDVPFGGGRRGRKNPLKIDGPDSIYKGRAVKDKNFPKWGGPGGKFVKIKDKCKKFPYCNQGDINALELLESEEMYNAIQNAAIKSGLNPTTVKNMVLKEIKDIFI